MPHPCHDIYCFADGDHLCHEDDCTGRPPPYVYLNEEEDNIVTEQIDMRPWYQRYRWQIQIGCFAIGWGLAEIWKRFL